MLFLAFDTDESRSLEKDLGDWALGPFSSCRRLGCGAGDEVEEGIVSLPLLIES